MLNNLVFHIDVNSAYLSWEASYRCNVLGETLDLREIPSVIGGDQAKRHGVVLAKSIPAKKYNVRTGEPIQHALTKCPNLMLIPPRHDLYQKYSDSLIELLRDYTPNIEQTSIDEAFLDMSGFYPDFDTAITAAEQLKNRIRDELRFTVNIGISTNKLLAKMASDFRKPDLVHTLFPHEVADKMWPLPVRELYGIGKATERRLLELGIKTIGVLAGTSSNILISHFKKQGEMIYKHANGIDDSLVNGDPVMNKGYGNSMTIPFDVTDYETARMILLSLSETVGCRLRAHSALAAVICVELTDCNFVHSSHQKTLMSPTDVTYEIQQTAAVLFRELWDGRTPVRLLGVRAGKITEEDNRQMNLFDFDKTEKLSKLDEAIDNIRKKYGKGSVMRASFLQDPVEGMEERE